MRHPLTKSWKRNLETFLGGMETLFGRYPPFLAVHLETFLGGMETRNLEGRAQPEKGLETFLGGMETTELAGLAEGTENLETFLGGMETCGQIMPTVPPPALKPSLVEWKPVSTSTSKPALAALETFLGGMETRCPTHISRPRKLPLKPSLVEWKLSGFVVGNIEPSTLKPSLVEWKHERPYGVRRRQLPLETFLGGMETHYGDSDVIDV